ncbi:MAG: hypothetical protein K0R67_1206 [Paenibacillus sp.]|jgi:copper transport protein|nr:hypothetical protein [Paenibacillus sp.]
MRGLYFLRNGARVAALLFVVLSLFGSGLFGYVQNASAHAILVKAEPEPNTRLQEQPEQIVLSFNERLESELFYIKVFDEIGRQVAKEKAVLSQDQKILTLQLPELEDGRFTVSYHVVSADGHPIEGAYVIVVGQTAGGAGVNPEQSLHENHGLSTNMSLTDLLRYIFRIVYYMSLLSLAGVVFWGLFLRPHILQSTASLAFYKSWLLSLQRIHLIALLAFIYFHFQDLLGDAGVGQLMSLFTGTWVGRSWALSLILSLLGFVLLYRNKLLDGIWFVLLLGVKSLNGHSMGYDPQWITVALNWVHLSAAAIWVGGLLLIMTGWKPQKEFVDAFLPRFSRGALIALVVLVITGTVTTLIYLPGLNYLLYSQWGKLLIAKVVFVALVLMIGAGIRFAMKKRNEKDLRDYLRLDLAAMAIILTVVGLMTYISPVPPNEPLYWHEMGEEVHMTTRISPKVPGDNQIQVDIWMLEKDGLPKNIVLNLQNKDKKDLSAISVPLVPSAVEKEEGEFEEQDRYVKYTYKASGPFIPFAGNWALEFRVMDSQDDETVYKQEIRVY